jgi:hypothetical protein
MPTLVKDFADQYRFFADDELLQLAVDCKNLMPAASAALEAELSARGLGEEAVQGFREHLRTPPDEENGSLQQEPLPPTDLPDHHRDEKPTAPSLASCRPKGITVCAFIFWLSGVIGAVEGGMSISRVAGVVVLMMSLATFVSGCGLWRLRPWARKLGLILCWTTVSVMCLNLVVAAKDPARNRHRTADRFLVGIYSCLASSLGGLS